MYIFHWQVAIPHSTEGGRPNGGGFLATQLEWTWLMTPTVCAQVSCKLDHDIRPRDFKHDTDLLKFWKDLELLSCTM